MTTETSLVASIGFRHIVEDGLAILNEEELSVPRRGDVLDDLTVLLQEAYRGSELIEQKNLFAGTENKKAFQTFRLINRHLRAKYGNQLPEKLHATVSVFKNLKDGAPMAEGDCFVGAELLTELLASMRREGGTGIPAYPEEMPISP